MFKILLQNITKILPNDLITLQYQFRGKLSISEKYKIFNYNPYCLSKKSWPILYRNLIYKMGQDFGQVQYILHPQERHFFIALIRSFLYYNIQTCVCSTCFQRAEAPWFQNRGLVIQGCPPMNYSRKKSAILLPNFYQPERKQNVTKRSTILKVSLL